MVVIERLKSILSYDPMTGVFTWKRSMPPRGRVGAIAGTLMTNGYRVIGVNGDRILAHRMAWAFEFGEWPPEHIDHANGCHDDNRIGNLRSATRSNNMHNSKIRATNTSGYKGVYWHSAAKKWAASITLQSKARHLGLFDDPACAHHAYCLAASDLHGQFANTGIM